MSDKILTEEEAELLLKKLSKFYGQPVFPMKKFCDGITTWFRCIEKLEDKEGRTPGKEYKHHLRTIERDILKSSLLGRIFYGGEDLRTDMCPKHKGTWSGLGDCPFGCELTGWLPNSKEERDERSWMLAKIDWVKNYKSVILRSETKLDSYWDHPKLENTKSTMSLRIKSASIYNYYMVKFVVDRKEAGDYLSPGKKFTLRNNKNNIIAYGQIQ